MPTCLIALGSNLGDRAAQLRQATAELAHLPATRLIARSRWYETPPIGGPTGQGPFLNAAALVSTSLSPAELLAALRRIEANLGRVRNERWATRSLDLDVLIYDAVVIQSAELEIPHPRMAFRRFVLEPAAEVAAWMIHPESSWTVGGLLGQLNRGVQQIAVAAEDDSTAALLMSQLAERLNLSIAPAGAASGDRPVITRWSVGEVDVPSPRPKLLLAAAAGTDSAKLRRMLHLPPTGPIAWVAPDSADALHDAVAAVQSIWPSLATGTPLTQFSMPAAPSRSLSVLVRGEEIRAAVLAARQAGESVGFVPTMGALHEGHLSLIDAAAAECDRVAASIFVNPTQFGPNEDLSRYPRPLDRDLELLRSRGCELVFVPKPAEMYPPGFDTFIDVGAVAHPWEGVARPGHFRGVATVVHKLFQLVPANRAYFGQKDYQQSLVVRRMAADLDMPIEICVCPIVRDADGLALSSRNVYLSSEERQRALSLSQSLQLAGAAIAAGETGAEAIRQRMLAHIGAAGGVQVEYIAIVRDGTVDEVSRIEGPVTIAVAAKVGTTRLIDNVRIG